ncbi:hypothetical protein [Nannocystis pusilla]|uniref:hypothetical protein n=1 Tax=Nannocystis pusilla TaxID=889268 RepID=UPI003B761F7D
MVRAAPGNWGMTFIFGGLGPLSVAGHGDQPLADGLMFTEIGVRRVLNASSCRSRSARASLTARARAPPARRSPPASADRSQC